MPENILKAWREIGKKGIELEKKWIETLGKKNSKIKSELENVYIKSDLNNLESLIKDEKKIF